MPPTDERNAKLGPEDLALVEALCTGLPVESVTEFPSSREAEATVIDVEAEDAERVLQERQRKERREEWRAVVRERDECPFGV